MNEKDPNKSATYGEISDPKTLLAHTKMHLDAGILGKFFGGTSASHNISGLLILLLVISGIGSLFLAPQQSMEFWGIITPIITLTLGYLFGKNLNGK